MTILEKLPDWSQTTDTKYRADYSALKDTSIRFCELSETERRAEVESYSAQYCSPRFNLSKASGLYLLLRVAFRLPREYPRESAMVFGGWSHPSTTKSDQQFLISWPVDIDEQTHEVSVATFRGYFGVGYDAIGEYDYFLQHFRLRSPQAIRELRFPR